MANGKRKLYDKYVEAETLKTDIRGRSADRLNRRNDKIINRFYFYSMIRKMNYEHVIDELAKEFDLAPRTITDMLLKNDRVVAEVMTKKPPVVDLKKKYPYLSWN